METEIKLPLTMLDIQKILPHRFPMLLVDRVLEFEAGVNIVGRKNVSANEHFFVGHFPERPLMPGVLMLEALAQLGVIFFKLSSGQASWEKLIVFAGVDDCKFRRPVIPGDVLRLEMKLLRMRSGIWKMQGIASVEGETAVEAVLTAAEANG